MLLYDNNFFFTEAKWKEFKGSEQGSACYSDDDMVSYCIYLKNFSFEYEFYIDSRLIILVYKPILRVTLVNTKHSFLELT